MTEYLAGNYSYIIQNEPESRFSTEEWESSLVLFLMISGACTLIITMILAYYWDKYNPGLTTASVETEKTYRYWDPNKVEAVLCQLEKEFIRQLTETGKEGKKDTTVAISKILNSGLVNKLMLENSKDLKDTNEENSRGLKPHIVESLMSIESQEENMMLKTRKYLKRGLDDPRHIPTLVPDPVPRGNNSRRDLDTTIAQLRLHLHHLETNANIETPIDLFLQKYDESLKLSPVLKKKLNLDKRDLKRNDLKALGVNPSEFRAMKVSKNGKVIADSSLLTGGKYCKLIYSWKNYWRGQKILWGYESVILKFILNVCKKRA